MKSKLPKEVTILGREHTVKVEKCSSEEDMGEMLRGYRTIRISPSHPKDTLESTLFHECVHAALYTAGLSELLTEDQEEAVVICMESAFAHAIDLDKLK
jgi:hypothetical protein